MWWKDRSEIGKTAFSLRDVRLARSYFYSKLRQLAPAWLQSPSSGKHKNHFVETWSRPGLYPLAFITYLGNLLRFLESATAVDGRDRLDGKIRSLLRLPDGQLQDLLTELFVASQFAGQFAPLHLEPVVGRGDRRADFSFEWQGQQTVVDVTRLSVKAFSDAEMILREIQKRASAMCHRKMIHRQARLRFNFLPAAGDKDAILRRVSTVFAEGVKTPHIRRTCEITGGRAIEVEVDDLPVVYGDCDEGRDDTEARRLRVVVDPALKGRVRLGGIFAVASSVDREAFVRLLESNFHRKLRNTIRAKVDQRMRGKPFILVVDLSQVQALGTRLTDETCEDMLDRQLHRHPQLSALCLFTRGQPWYRKEPSHNIYMSAKSMADPSVQLSEAFLRRWARGSWRVTGLESLRA